MKTYSRALAMAGMALAMMDGPSPETIERARKINAFRSTQHTMRRKDWQKRKRKLKATKDSRRTNRYQ